MLTAIAERGAVCDCCWLGPDAITGEAEDTSMAGKASSTPTVASAGAGAGAGADAGASADDDPADGSSPGRTSSGQTESCRSANGSSYPPGSISAFGADASGARRPTGDKSRESSDAGSVSANAGGGTSRADGDHTAGFGTAGKGFVVTASRTGACSAAAAGVGKGGRHANGVTGSRLSSPGADPDAPAVRKAGTAGVGTSITRGDGATGDGAGNGEANGASAGGGAGDRGERAEGPDGRGAACCAVRVAAPSPVAVVGGAVYAVASAGAPMGGCVGGGATPHARPTSETRATGAGGGLTSVNDTSGSNEGGADGSKCADASNTSLHWPQRTHPSDMRNWSATTLKEVAQDGQRVIWLISGGL